MGRLKQEEEMESERIRERVIEILTPFVKDRSALEQATSGTNMLDDLKVNSARFVDIVLAIEDAFDIEISDDELDSVNTIGDCVSMIASKS
jgi:acyl carrier protein